jgi:hypothetical protein
MAQMFSQQHLMQLLLRFSRNFEEHIEFDGGDVFYSTENKFFPSKNTNQEEQRSH